MNNRLCGVIIFWADRYSSGPNNQGEMMANQMMTGHCPACGQEQYHTVPDYCGGCGADYFPPARCPVCGEVLRRCTCRDRTCHLGLDAGGNPTRDPDMVARLDPLNGGCGCAQSGGCGYCNPNGLL